VVTGNIHGISYTFRMIDRLNGDGDTDLGNATRIKTDLKSQIMKLLIYTIVTFFNQFNMIRGLLSQRVMSPLTFLFHTLQLTYPYSYSIFYILSILFGFHNLSSNIIKISTSLGSPTY
jgi:hypothetical protein